MNIFTRYLSVALAASLLATASVSVHAALVSIDPDAFPNGTDISNAFPGVTLSASGAGVDGKVFSTTAATASTGTQVFGNSSGILNGTLWGSGPGITFRADFGNLTDFVSIDVIPSDGNDPATLSAFDSGGGFLESFTTTGASGIGVPEVASISRAIADIAFVTVFDPLHNYLLDNFQLNGTSVPEPTTLLLLGLGLAGLGFAKRRVH